MNKILRVLTTFSIIVFVGVLLIVYAFLPDPTGILFSKSGDIIYSISRNIFFYAFLIIFFLVQLIFYLFRNYVLNNWLENKGKQRLIIWFRGMFLLINLFFILFVSFLGFANNAVDYTYSSVVSLAIAGPLLMLLWLLILPFIFFSSSMKKRNWRINFSVGRHYYLF